MPITKGHGNPIWARDETLLALDLLYRHGKPISPTHEDAVELSEFLRKAPLHPIEVRKESFRNPDGVALKLQNLFSAVEPGRGLTSSNGDKAVVAEFPKERHPELAEVARVIRAALAEGQLDDPTTDDETFTEGRWLTARHRSREHKLRKRLLSKYQSKPLKCEVCDFTPPALERRAQESLFEAHHTIPLSQAEGERKTSVSDLALLCACCHRLAHRLISTHKRWVSVAEVRSVWTAAATHD
jgi:5-methylcytosine-specific restriction protein A